MIFSRHGGKLLLGGEREDVTSVLIVNVKGIKMYVDRQNGVCSDPFFKDINA